MTGRPAVPGADGTLIPDAVAFVAELARRHDPPRQRLLAARRERQAALDAGARPRDVVDRLDGLVLDDDLAGFLTLRAHPLPR